MPSTDRFRRSSAMTQAQKDFFARYQGHAVVVRNSTEAAAEIARYVYSLFVRR